jgi:prepilin-type N-terminal cleavage/methylation domain-containing protein
MQKCEERCSGGSRRGFTLVELLVVVGVIAVLVAILLPALNRARESANALKCLSNLRQCGTALSMYLNDNKGWFPYVARDNSWKPWSATTYGTRSPAAVGTQQGDAQRQNAHRALMKYLGGRFDRATDEVLSLATLVFRCPSTVDFPFASQAPNAFNNTSYTANGVFINRRVTSVRRSSEIIAFSESRYGWNVSAMRPYPSVALTPNTNMDGVQYQEWMWYETGSVGGPNRLLNFTVHYRDQKGTVAFADGHGETLSYKDVRPSHFGLTDGDPAATNRGLATDTWAQIGTTRRYSAKLN